MKRQALLITQAKLRLATIMFFLLLGRDRLWRNPPKRVEREENFKVLKRCHIQIYPRSFLFAV